MKWAKEKIEILEKQLDSGNGRRDELTKTEIIVLSQKYGILSTVTSLVAIYKRTVKETGMPETIVIPVAKPRGWDLFEEPANVNYCFAAPPKASSRSLAGNARYSGVCEDELDIPCFLRKTTSGSSRRSKTAKSMESGTRLSKVYSQPETLAFEACKDSVSMQNTVVSDSSDEINELIRRASEKQNADGSFGKASDAGKNTSFYIIGMLLLKEDWKPYRIQITKAGSVIMKNDMDNLLLKVIALYMIHEKRLYQGISFQITFDNMAARLTANEKEIFEAFKNGEYESLGGYIGKRFNEKTELSHFILSKLHL